MSYLCFYTICIDNIFLESMIALLEYKIYIILMDSYFPDVQTSRPLFSLIRPLNLSSPHLEGLTLSSRVWYSLKFIDLNSGSKIGCGCSLRMTTVSAIVR